MTHSSAAARMIESAAASRVHAADANLYDFSEVGLEFGRNFMGWTTLSTNPPFDVHAIQCTAEELCEKGFTSAILIGQGGSTQAPMTMSEYVGGTCGAMSLYVLDSLAPASVRDTLAKVDLEKTVLVVSSKSGGTLEVLTMLQVMRAEFARVMPEQDIAGHFVAITDPGSKLEQIAKTEGWAAVLSGEPTVGGRFSALSVFGLLPAALMGIDLVQLLKATAEVELACAQDSPDNPAVRLAAFMYDAYQQGRDCMSFLTAGKAKAFGLWLEQLVAESLGKNGLGIAPNLEHDPALLSRPIANRTAIVYRTSADSPTDQEPFDAAVAQMDASIPCMEYSVGTIESLAGHFVIWEYAVALCGWLMGVCPFDQPDVQSAKTAVLHYLDQGLPEPDFAAALSGEGEACEAAAQVRVSPRVAEAMEADLKDATLADALRALLAQVESADCLSINAFLPTTDACACQILEGVRRQLASNMGVATCLEMGPRYLHSVGQLQKGGPDTAAVVLISAEEVEDVPVDGVAKSLGNLEKTQAVGDFMTLASRGRRCVHVHLPDNRTATLQALAAAVGESLPR